MKSYIHVWNTSKVGVGTVKEMKQGLKGPMIIETEKPAVYQCALN